MTGLALNNVEIQLNGRKLLSVSTTVKPGEVLTIMGPSGSGKSSLLGYIGGFLTDDFQASGDVLLNGASILQRPAHERQMGLLFQDPLLFPHMSVGENLMFALPASAARGERRTEVNTMLDEVGLSGYYDRDPATLSGGQKARIALARVLLSRPAGLLLDEPFSKLDTALRDQMRKLVFSEARLRGLPTVLVTHDEADAQAAGGDVILLNGDSG